MVNTCQYPKKKCITSIQCEYDVSDGEISAFFVGFCGSPGDLPLVPDNRTGQMQSIVGLNGIRRSLRFALAAWLKERGLADGAPTMDGLLENPMKIDDFGGYPYFRKPPGFWSFGEPPIILMMSHHVAHFH